VEGRRQAWFWVVKSALRSRKKIPFLYGRCEYGYYTEKEIPAVGILRMSNVRTGRSDKYCREIILGSMQITSGPARLMCAHNYLGSTSIGAYWLLLN
jgi:hypothetical protein